MTEALREALERIAAATPTNTNSATIESFRSWVHAVATTALVDDAHAQAGTGEGPAEALKPEFEIGAVVEYTDNHRRVQVGTVQSIEAHWHLIYGSAPLVLYLITHPTYQNNRCYVRARNIEGRVATDRPSQGA